MTKTLIHVRFAPDGAVFEIGERPAALTAQQWYATLAERAGSAFASLSGGRGVFRLTEKELAALKAPTLQ